MITMLDSVQAQFYTRASLRDWSRTSELIRFVIGQGVAYEPRLWSAERATGRQEVPFCGDLEPLRADLQDPAASSVEFAQEPFGAYMLLVDWGSRLAVARDYLTVGRVLLRLGTKEFDGKAASDQVDHWLSVLVGIYERTGANFGFSHETRDRTRLTRVEETVGRQTRSRDRTDSVVPSLFWADFFGPDLVAAIGRERLAQAPCWRKEALRDGGLLLVFSPNPLDFADTHELRQRLYVDWDLERLTKPVCRPASDAPAPMPLSDAVVESAERCRELAEVCVQTARRVSGVYLDYSRESLRALDEVIRQGWPVGAQPQEVIGVMGCYLGETIIRRLGGAWS
jgi:hypothetical protein